MKLKNVLILSAAVVALGMGSVSVSKAFAAGEPAVAATTDVKVDAPKVEKVKKAAHHKKHAKHSAHKGMKKEVAPAEVPATNQ
ncbi:MAG: hypothetical protein JWO78_374 [Micavibrio sp.]|nr:hypothetical protein [Micavibrio sp.]